MAQRRFFIGTNSVSKGDSWRKKVVDTMLSFIIPSSSKAFQDKRQERIQIGKLKCEQYQDEFNNLRKIIPYYVHQRREASHQLAKCVDPDSLTVPNLDMLKRCMSAHREMVATCEHLERQMSTLEKNVETITEMAATESCLGLTGYKGIRDWASETWEAYSDLVQAISTICFVGAGLTYSSIFSATRGDLGLMAWAFTLFIAGMIISVTVRAFLVQCARLENYPFSTPRLWEVFLGIFIYTACFAVVAAICLLLLTVLKLDFAISQGGASDAPLTFEVSPRSPALLGFSAIGIGIFFALVVIGVFVLANGADALLWRRRSLRTKQNVKRRRLDDFV